MEKRTIGRTELSVNEIGFGAMHLSIDRTRRPDEAASVALIRRMVDDLDVDFIDTADAYCADDSETGHNERLIAEALRGERRLRVVVATKGGSVRPGGRWERNGRPEHLRRACEASLRALETYRIDLYQLHAPDPAVPVEESVGALGDLQREGKILHVGVSNFSVEQLERSMRETAIVSVQNQFSVINRDADDDAMIAFCEENGLTFIPWNPVGGRGIAPKLAEESAALRKVADRHNTGPHAIALAWLLQRSPCIIPIPGSRSIDHVEENMRAAEITLDEDDLATLDEAR
jgi:aryl-alcohol dehydrogenase-like predicted oxidoreductase